MQYKLLKDLPGIKAGTVLDIEKVWKFCSDPDDYNDFFEPIKEKKRYEDLKEGDEVWYIFNDKGVDWDYFSKGDLRSDVFLTREEAEDEYKRREWAVRPDKFIPEIGEEYFYPTQNGIVDKWTNSGTAGDFMLINAGLAFKRYTHCEKAVKEHDLDRLFYTIR